MKTVLKKKYTPQISDNQHIKKVIWGLKFEHPIGLAAGFDKNGKWIDELSYLGFSFIEIGTLTPKPQLGNPKKRLFRLPLDKAIINRMGFNNDGVNLAIKRLKKRKSNVIIGGNIGKNKITNNKHAIDDYLYSLKQLHDYVDYFVVNVSSPNTPGLRELQDKKPLLELLTTLQAENMKYQKQKPILLKIAPELNELQINDIAMIVKDINLDGLVVSNTTIGRDGLKTDKKVVEDIGNGGLSGKPVRELSTSILRLMRAKVGDDVPIIAVGGVFTVDDAMEKIKAGASLVQVYTGFVYEGPSMVKNIVNNL